MDPTNHLSEGQKRPLLTQDPNLLKLLKTAEVVAASQTSILIEGESGTGKELLARFIHQRSLRADRPFVAINCAAVPETLLESELFGYEKGAFTGAAARKPGRFELAHTGTLLLDEVSEMHLSLQAKLLRVLQEREVDLLGGKGPLPLDIRIIATTNRPLWEEVKAGRFREDLYYRLNVFPLRLPPLRLRPVDIPLLADHFVKKRSARNRRSVVSISTEAISILMGREWRGNVREFENVIERAVLLADRGVITPDHLLFEESFVSASPFHTSRSTPRPTTVREAERELILETLQRVGDNRTHAARLLGISIRTLRNKLREYRGEKITSGNFCGKGETENDQLV
ncbi:MAG: sigma-54 dependent transcriptional regulator [Candidatus Manganitrophaceae bacterium]